MCCLRSVVPARHGMPSDAVLVYGKYMDLVCEDAGSSKHGRRWSRPRVARLPHPDAFQLDDPGAPPCAVSSCSHAASAARLTYTHSAIRPKRRPHITTWAT